MEHFGMGPLGAQFDAEPAMAPTHALDDVVAEAGIDRVDVIKVDVEGFERDVFQGAARVLTAETSLVVVFEFCDWAEDRASGRRGEAQELLKDLGYGIWRLRDAIEGRAPLASILTNGFETLVASSQRAGQGREQDLRTERERSRRALR